MGAWGYESPSNDGTMDLLCESCKDIYNPTQEEADKCLEEYFGDEVEDYDRYALGLVVWFLEQGMRVETMYLTPCLEDIILREMDKLSDWSKPEARRKC